MYSCVTSSYCGSGKKRSQSIGFLEFGALTEGSFYKALRDAAQALANARKLGLCAQLS